MEFAIIGPLFFLSAFAILEAALYVNAYVSVNNATREGARAAAICGDAVIFQPYAQQQQQLIQLIQQGQNYNPNQPITASMLCSAYTQTTINSHLGFLSVIPGVNPSVTITCAKTCQAGDTITIAVQYTYTFLLPYLLDLKTPTPIDTTVQAVSQQ